MQTLWYFIVENPKYMEARPKSRKCGKNIMNELHVNEAIDKVVEEEIVWENYAIVEEVEWNETYTNN